MEQHQHSTSEERVKKEQWIVVGDDSELRLTARGPFGSEIAADRYARRRNSDPTDRFHWISLPLQPRGK